ncbi:MAG: UDP-glucose/GDP-mannose dehydrogenase family protein [Candidatus Omnitrophica bacterium]|nr:UDP-glucose/GDP-mannose dehydrogenase family protein [Candidatus Omnitrophota bacterium]MDD5574232.1 UDP-glucose/GDP-mannose dehydrogenase family protein [Candidatus Omnitrophota bacterium]
MKIAIIGTGYVGLVTGACFAELKHRVVCVDNDASKVRALKMFKVPFYEPGLEEMVRRHARNGRLSFSTQISSAVKNSDVIFIAVGTPPKENGEADLTGIESVVRAIATSMHSYRLIVEKSTVPVDTGRRVQHTIETNKAKNVPFDVASNPEFLREGQAIHDFLHPDRIVIGVESARAEKILRQLYADIPAPLIVTDIKSAELIKHASNSFLALKISYINAVARVCEAAGADVERVAEGMGLDGRIGRTFLDAGIGFGGFCLPKDLDAFVGISQKLGYDFGLLKEAKKINESQKELFVRKIENRLWNIKNKTIAVCGLSFKPNTDDMRFAPSVDIIALLQQLGARIRACDPQATKKAKGLLKDVVFCRDVYEAARGSDCLIIVTEWNEFKEMDLKRIKKLLKQPIIIDGRNIFDPALLEAMGFSYVCIGRTSK